MLKNEIKLIFNYPIQLVLERIGKLVIFFEIATYFLC